jgi:hypothetical protein
MVALLPAFRASRSRETLAFFAALLATLLLACISGSLKGAGRHHLIPWLPSVVMGAALFLRDGKTSRALRFAPAALALSALCLAVSAFRHTGDELRLLARYPGRDVVAELVRIQESHPGKAIEMGYGTQYWLSFYRPVLVFKNSSFLLDGAALIDMQPAGLETTAATVERIRRCDPPLWLFPKGEAPLGLRHVAPPYQPIFSPSFKAEFASHYRLSEDYRFYSLWECVS